MSRRSHYWITLVLKRHVLPWLLQKVNKNSRTHFIRLCSEPPSVSCVVWNENMYWLCHKSGFSHLSAVHSSFWSSLYNKTSPLFIVTQVQTLQRAAYLVWWRSSLHVQVFPTNTNTTTTTTTPSLYSFSVFHLLSNAWVFLQGGTKGARDVSHFRFFRNWKQNLWLGMWQRDLYN